MELGQLYDYPRDKTHSGWIPRSDVIEDIGDSGDVTIFKSVGIGLQDVAIAKVVVEKAIAMNVGTRIPSFDT